MLIIDNTQLSIIFLVTEDGVVTSKLSGSYIPCGLFQCLRKKSLRDYSIFRSTIMRLLTNTPIHSINVSLIILHKIKAGLAR